MSYRTTVLLDEQSRRAARELALRYDCSVSEAIRRAIVRQRDLVSGPTPKIRQRRRQALETLFELFDGHDADDEIKRLKEQDEGA